MAITKLNPYMYFNGQAEAAMELYVKVLGAKAGPVMRYGEVPVMQVPDELRNLVMHVQLEIGGGMVMLSDVTPDRAAATVSHTQVCLHFDNVAEMEVAFPLLAEGGRVGMAMHDTFFGARLGTLVDRFGMRWMMICEKLAA